METKITKDIDICAKIIRSGGVVAMPTETVYGLSASIYNEGAIKKIYEIKGRPSDNPLIVHISNICQLEELTRDIPPIAYELTQKYFPGPLTLIFKKSAKVPDIVTAGLDSVAIRMPNHKMALKFIKKCGTPLVAPSANLSSRPSPTKAGHVFDDLEGRISYILDGGDCQVGIESTVIDISGIEPIILRPGTICPDIRQVTGENHKIALAPGMKYKHYAPMASLTLFCGEPKNTANEILERLNKDIAVMCFTDFYDIFKANITYSYGKSDDYSEQAKNIFSALRYFDKQNVKEIYAQCPIETNLSSGICNRLKKASGFNIINID